jgi:hypothetical protein
MKHRSPWHRGYTSFLCFFGLFCTAISLVELCVFRRPDFYTLFSVGMTLLLLGLHDAVAPERLFAGWSVKTWAIYGSALLLFCVIIDRTGMALGFWHYPHYDGSDEIRKYVFEWGVALLYHLAAYRAGVAALRRVGVALSAAAVLSMGVGVTLVGLLTEWLNLFVLSWEVLHMPITDARIGPFFLVFQTIGYWLMVIFPYGIYLVVDRVAVRRRRTARRPRPLDALRRGSRD